MSHFNYYMQLQEDSDAEEVKWCLKDDKESPTKDAILGTESQSEAIQVKVHRDMNALDASANKLFIQQLAQKLFSSPHQPPFTGNVSIVDRPKRDPKITLKIWDIYGNRLPKVIGYVTCKAQ